MLQVVQVVNSIYTSNTFVIHDSKINFAWLIDIGDYDKVSAILPNKVEIIGVFITHYHHDHIYGINKLLNNYPNCKVYVSEQGIDGLYSDKINLSFYHDESIVFNGSNVYVLKDQDRVNLYDNNFIEAIYTPGHNRSCLTYKLNEFLFTGDSYIPNVKVVTKLKGGCKDDAIKSVDKIMSHITKNTVLCPGHGDVVTGLADFDNH